MRGSRWIDVGPNPKVPPSEKTVNDQAAAWFARRRSGSWSALDDSEFAIWLKADPSHTAAWSAFERLWGRVDTVRDDPKILAIRERARRSAARGQSLRRISRVGGALAASLVVGILVWRNVPPSMLPLAHPPALPVPATSLVRDASTEIGERSLLVLADGSKVTLNTSSAVHADYSGHERRVTLVRGEAFFDVAKDPTRPFIVSAGSREVIAVGTAFDVRLQDRQMKVTLVEGKVRILRTVDHARHRAAVMLDAGSALVASEDSADHIEHLDTARVTSWRSGKLVFDGERLADVVAEMNRYSTQKLEIADPALEERRVSGVFEPTGGFALANALEVYGIARVTQQTATTIVLNSPQ
jgi:transmembrane sensor